MADIIVYISHAVAIVILGVNIAICISKHHKLKDEVKELIEINHFLLNKVDRLEREIRLSHDALLRTKEQLLKQTIKKP